MVKTQDSVQTDANGMFWCVKTGWNDQCQCRLVLSGDQVFYVLVNPLMMGDVISHHMVVALAARDAISHFGFLHVQHTG